MLSTTARRFQTLASTTSRSSRALLVRQLHRSAATAMPEIPFKLADIGEGIAEVEVLQWFIKEGDQIKQFQNVCEVQSDKVRVLSSSLIHTRAARPLLLTMLDALAPHRRRSRSRAATTAS